MAFPPHSIAVVTGPAIKNACRDRRKRHGSCNVVAGSGPSCLSAAPLCMAAITEMPCLFPHPFTHHPTVYHQVGGIDFINRVGGVDADDADARRAGIGDQHQLLYYHTHAVP
ncbi:hypothetical protein MSKU15_0923 [Komagataeibacter diospyri]|nr:hypothetical protein MSKU15_0923 [Komagataeibacter diospyri]